jgi:osmotically-inducible protein OsmY
MTGANQITIKLVLGIALWLAAGCRPSADEMEVEEPSSQAATTQANGNSQGNIRMPAPAADLSALTPAVITPQKPITERDRALAERVCKVLESDNSVAELMKKIKVSAADGKVTLRGTVAGEKQKEQLVTNVKEITGSDQFVDRVEVKQEQTNQGPPVR